MAKVIYNYKHYIVLDTKKDLIVRNSKGKYNNHGHFKRKTDKQGSVDLRTVKTFIRLIDNHRTDIRSRYLFEAAIRVVTDIDYLRDLNTLYKKKFKDNQHYYNSQKGVRF